MPITGVKTRWTNGKLEITDASGNNIAVFNPDTKTLEVPTGATLDASAGTLTLPNNAVTTAKIAASGVTFAKAAVFVSTEQTGTGAAQNIAHGLAAVPAAVLIVPTDTSPATVGVYTATEGVHTATNVITTVTSGKKFKVLAWA